MNRIHNAERVAQILESIPDSSEGAVTLFSLCEVADADDASCEDFCKSLLAILETFDAVTIDGYDALAGPNVKARSTSASYFLKSLAAYLREDRTIVSNWERPGISEGPYSVHEVLSGPQFLYFLEHNRTSGRNDALAIRKTDVVKAVIKAQIRGAREPVYLTQFDPFSRQYQLIGGHKRGTDPDIGTALRREMQEELHQNAIRFPTNYEIHHLDNVPRKELSLTYGVYTEYTLHYAQIVFRMPQLILGPNDRWVTLKELLSGETKDGVGINESAVVELDRQLPGGLAGLRLSLDQVQHRTLRQIAKDHPWETAGIILSVVGILLSILFFLLT